MRIVRNISWNCDINIETTLKQFADRLRRHNVIKSAVQLTYMYIYAHVGVVEILQLFWKFLSSITVGNIKLKQEMFVKH